MENNKIYKLIVVALLIVVFVLALMVVYLFGKSKNDHTNQVQQDQIQSQKGCTKEAKICPDGKTTVGRNPLNNCEFDPCPVTQSGETETWKKYSNSNLGIEIKYPSDGTYSVTEKEGGIVISQEHPGNRFSIEKVKKEEADILGSEEEKVINGKTFEKFNRVGMGSGFGYVFETESGYFVFESVYGPQNETFEIMMSTVNFSGDKNENVYINKEYGFQITLTDNWKGFKTSMRKINGNTIIDFSSPTEFTDSGFGVLFNIAINDKDEWDKEVEDCKKDYATELDMCSWGESELARNEKYVFTSSHINGDPGEDQLAALRDYEKVISTFALVD